MSILIHFSYNLHDTCIVIVAVAVKLSNGCNLKNLMNLNELKMRVKSDSFLLVILFTISSAMLGEQGVQSQSRHSTHRVIY